MEAKLQRQEQSVARFASIALLHLSLDSKKQKQQQKQLQQRRQGDDDEDDASTLWMTDAPTITLPQLMSLRSVFDSAPDGLSEEEFVSAFKKVGSRLSETHLRWWFRRIDADDSGNVDWHELSTFIISGSVDESGRIVAHDERPEDAMFAKEEKGVSMPATEASPNAIAGLNHSDFVTSVYCHPRNGKYFTGSQDGTVRVWDAQTMEFEYILHQGKWVTCMCASPDDTQLFVAGLDRTIVVYELTNLTKTPRYYVGNILDENHRVPKGRPIHRFEISTRHMVDPSASGVSGYRPGESLESFRLRNDRIRHSKIPDQTVEAYVLREMEFPANVMVCVPNSEILFMGLSSGRLQGYPLVHRSLLKGRFVECYMDVNPHENFPVTTLQYAEFFNGFLSTAADGSVALTDVRGQSVMKVGIAATPIYHAIWMEGPKLLATCGASRDISLWSASPQTSTTTLRGHYCSVVQLAFDANDNWLVSLDAERTIVIWNMHNLLPIQSITDYETYQLGRFSAMVYDATRNRILCASTAPVIFTKGTTSVPLADPSYKGHQRPLVGCLYNRVFHQIITADSECIKIWEATNGQQRSCLSIPSLRATGVPMKYAGGGSILSIRQDSSHRRLIISLSSATICIMSISNCHLVLECHRSTVKLPSSIDAGGSMFIPLPNSRVGKKGFGLVLGNKLLLWEDKDSVSNVPIGHEISFQMKAEQYETISRQQQTPLPPAFHARRNANLWRTPAPTCLASAEGLIAVGTDCGIVLVYLTTGIEPLGFIGAYEPSTIVTSLCWHEQSSSFVFSLSNGRVMFAHAFHRNKLIAICHEDDTNDPVAVLSLDVGAEYLVAGDEDGTVHTWRLRDINYETVHPFTIAVVSRTAGSSIASYVSSFRAHMNEVSSVVLCPVNDEHRTMRVLTSSSDCQSRIFSLDGLFVGYVGAPWKLSGTPQPRSVMRTIPAPIQDLRTSRSFLGMYLPGMPTGDDVSQSSEPIVEDVMRQHAGGPVVLTEGTTDHLAASSNTTLMPPIALRAIPAIKSSPMMGKSAMEGSGSGRPLFPPVELNGTLQVHSLVSPFISPRGSRTVREEAAAMLKELTPRHADANLLPSPPSPRRVEPLLGKPKVTGRSSRQTGVQNPLLQCSPDEFHEQLKERAAVPPPPLYSGQFMNKLSAPVAFASGGQSTRSPLSPNPKATLDSILEHTKDPEIKKLRRARQITAFEGVDELTPSPPKSPSVFRTHDRPDAAAVAALMPLLHLDRVPKPYQSGGGLDASVLSPSSPHSGRLDVWRSHHRQWASEQIRSTDLVKSARPMTLVRIQSLDNVLGQQLRAAHHQAQASKPVNTRRGRNTSPPRPVVAEQHAPVVELFNVDHE